MHVYFHSSPTLTNALFVFVKYDKHSHLNYYLNMTKLNKVATTLPSKIAYSGSVMVHVKKKMFGSQLEKVFIVYSLDALLENTCPNRIKMHSEHY